MRIGMSTASFFTKAPTEECFDLIKDMGIDICEVFLSSFSEYDGAIADTIASSRDIEVHSVHALTNQFEPELFSKNPRAEQDAQEVLSKVMNMARRLGATHYTFHGVTMLKKINYTLDYDRLGGIVNGLIDKCRSYGVQFDYENVHWAYFNNPQYFTELSARCPDLRATLDIKQAMQSHIPYSEYLDAVKGRLDTVHLCDYDDSSKLSLPGRGTFDFAELFARLSDSGFDGAALIEVYPQAYNDFHELQQAYEYILECKERGIASCK